MHVRRTDTAVEIATPAKINLLLEVLCKRPDGYHEIETVMVAVSVFDALVFRPLAEEEIKLSCRWIHGRTALETAKRNGFSTAGEAHGGTIPSGSQNLVWRAVQQLREQAGCKQGAEITLVKRIPLAAGLGGASSDAAAALIAANEGWQLGWPRERLVELAGQLGSDVPFFLTRGAAICRGRGEQIESLPPPRMHVVIAHPPVGLSTPEVYAGCQPKEASGRAASLLTALRHGNVAEAGNRLQNGLQHSATKLTPWINRLQQEFERAGLKGHQMSGSGSSYFGLCRTARHARQVAARLRARNLGTVFAATTAVAT